jgi:hypothetical protein
MPNEKPVPAPETKETDPDSLDPNESDMELDKLRGQTNLHATPPRLEDEGQSGG